MGLGVSTYHGPSLVEPSRFSLQIKKSLMAYLIKPICILFLEQIMSVWKLFWLNDCRKPNNSTSSHIAADGHIR